jgi:hypothetical protein
MSLSTPPPGKGCKILTTHATTALIRAMSPHMVVNKGWVAAYLVCTLFEGGSCGLGFRGRPGVFGHHPPLAGKRCNVSTKHANDGLSSAMQPAHIVA